MSAKSKDRTAAALAAMGLGAQEAVVPANPRQAAAKPKAPAPKAPKVQVSIQFTLEGLRLLRQAQARLLERGVPRSTTTGVALEVVLREWLNSDEE